ncbi:GTP-binding protein [Actinomadura geliboluensis]|uniref:ATP-binding protein n=1 Tax=Actinomadura geliboluensis TaxID=882440 RepID=A0A5S4GEG0_9ACTN|nr:ATP/GTP-binding protein [Actinomadura geliboluensis]TMR30884.1 ATP-binding protein [Actinomadura geliboluensis]
MSPDRTETAGPGRRNPTPLTVKIIISGGFGVGKTTMIGAVSEIDPLTTEEQLTVVSDGVDSLVGVEDKTTTTVALDFGRLTFDQQQMVLYLFGTPGQDRYWFTWDDLTYGAVGAAVLVDTRRLPDSFGPVGYFEQRGIPFVVAINEFADAPHHYTAAEVRHALDIAGHVPIVRCDARDTRSAITVLLALVDHALAHPPLPEQPHQPIAQGAST